MYKHKHTSYQVIGLYTKIFDVFFGRLVLIKSYQILTFNSIFNT